MLATTVAKTSSTPWKASMEEDKAWVEAAVCKSIPRSSCRCSVPRWEAVAAEAEAEEASRASGGCQEVEEALPRASPAASSSDMTMRRTNPGGSPRTTRPPIPTPMQRRGRGRGRRRKGAPPPPSTRRFGGFVNWGWGSCWLASSSLLISW